jgi:hypothetical protein
MSTARLALVFSYKQVEKALADVHFVPEDAMGAFRGRLQHFQRLGMVPSTPGRGRKISYERAAVFFWAFALELAEFGMDPKVIKHILDTIWPAVRPYLIEDHNGPDRYFFFSPRLIGKDAPKNLQQSLSRPRGVPYSLAFQIIFDLADLDKPPRTAAARAYVTQAKNRYGLINLGSLRRDVEKALSA